MSPSPTIDADALTAKSASSERSASGDGARRIACDSAQPLEGIGAGGATAKSGAGGVPPSSVAAGRGARSGARVTRAAVAGGVDGLDRDVEAARRPRRRRRSCRAAWSARRSAPGSCRPPPARPRHRRWRWRSASPSTARRRAARPSRPSVPARRRRRRRLPTAQSSMRRLVDRVGRRAVADGGGRAVGAVTSRPSRTRGRTGRAAVSAGCAAAYMTSCGSSTCSRPNAWPASCAAVLAMPTTPP